MLAAIIISYFVIGFILSAMAFRITDDDDIALVFFFIWPVGIVIAMLLAIWEWIADV